MAKQEAETEAERAELARLVNNVVAKANESCFHDYQWTGVDDIYRCSKCPSEIQMTDTVMHRKRHI